MAATLFQQLAQHGYHEHVDEASHPLVGRLLHDVCAFKQRAQADRDRSKVEAARNDELQLQVSCPPQPIPLHSIRLFGWVARHKTTCADRRRRQARESPTGKPVSCLSLMLWIARRVSRDSVLQQVPLH